MNPPGRVVRIGGAAGYWGDSAQAPAQLLDKGRVDYLVFDYLAEVTMSILVRARQKSPELGYARDFIDLVMQPLLPRIKAGGVKVVVNAGGVNVRACAAALAAVARTAGIELRIGVVEGDDLIAGSADPQTVIPPPYRGEAPRSARLVSANAYLGAWPIAAALGAGADVVITGRCVDSALTLGPLIHEFGWRRDDFDRLAAGSLAGHLLECGAQATGGNFTDWREVASGWHDMGYPIVVCEADGRFTITKPPGTGGLVSPLTVGEQMLYEIGDPSAYVLPDVVCDFTAVTMKQVGDDQVRVEGARGRAPTPTLKVSSTWMDGYRATSATVVTGFDAVDKARTCADALFVRLNRLMTERGLGGWRGKAVHLIGAQTLWGGNAEPQAASAREIVLQIDVHHDSMAAVEWFSKESVGVALSMTTGRCAAGGSGRPRVSPVIAQFAFLVDRRVVDVRVSVNEQPVVVTDLDPALCMPLAATSAARLSDADSLPLAGSPTDRNADAPSDWVDVPLLALAVARSGDKGDDANIGVIARREAWLPYIVGTLTEANVRAWFAHTIRGEVRRYRLPGIHGLNFVLTQTLDGGGTSSLHLDSQAKTYAQQLLAMPVAVPPAVADDVLSRAGSIR